MSGKRISREKETIAKMIALYEKQCPQASQDAGHYQALKAYAEKRLDKCVFGRKSRLQTVSGALLPGRQARRDEAGYALGRPAYVMAPSHPDRSSSD